MHFVVVLATPPVVVAQVPQAATLVKRLIFLAGSWVCLDGGFILPSPNRKPRTKIFAIPPSSSSIHSPPSTVVEFAFSQGGVF